MNDLYNTQRAMREMRKFAIQRGVIAVIDAGSSKVACLILRFDSSDDILSGEVIGSLSGQSTFRKIGAATTKSRAFSCCEIVSMV